MYNVYLKNKTKKMTMESLNRTSHNLLNDSTIRLNTAITGFKLTITRCFSLKVEEKKVSIIRKYHNDTQQTNPRHHEEKPQNTDCHKTPRRQLN